MSKDLKSLTFEEIVSLIEALGSKKYLADYIFAFIHSKCVSQIEQITTLSKHIRQQLVDEGFFISSAKPVERLCDADGTEKYLFQFDDGLSVESVLLRDKDRKTVCLSTQSGCPLSCEFCATGKIGFNRNLSAGEIVSQVYEVEKIAGKINNVVYMGMGEPFLNYNQVIKSLHILNHPKGKNIGAKHLTVSTCGLPNEIVKFSNENINARLAISLHSASDDVRSQLMPINNKFNLEKVMDAARQYQQNTRNRITIEYIMIKGINDREIDCRRLVKLLAGIKCNVNLIEFNRHSGCEFEPSTRNTIRKFAEQLEANGVESVIRFKKGQEILAACGQLGAKSAKKEL